MVSGWEFNIVLDLLVTKAEPLNSSNEFEHLNNVSIFVAKLVKFLLGALFQYFGSLFAKA